MTAPTTMTDAMRPLTIAVFDFGGDSDGTGIEGSAVATRPVPSASASSVVGIAAVGIGGGCGGCCGRMSVGSVGGRGRPGAFVGVRVRGGGGGLGASGGAWSGMFASANEIVVPVCVVS